MIFSDLTTTGSGEGFLFFLLMSKSIPSSIIFIRGALTGLYLCFCGGLEVVEVD